MRIRYKILYITFFFMLFFIFINIPTTSFGNSPGYIIENYIVKINVNKNNSFDVEETITVNFLEEKHGIVRKIPISNLVTRNDGSTSRNYATISNIEVNDQYTTPSSSGYKTLKIGRGSQTLIGEHVYTIKYRYSIIGKDGLDDADEFYFNIIGTEWDTSIENASFSITMPKEFDETLLGFSTGSIGEEGSTNLEYSVDGTLITGKILHPLNPYEGINIRLTLPDEYFFNIISFCEKYFFIILNFCTKNYITIVLIIGLLFILKTFILWYKYGKDYKVIDSVEFYPPKGYTSAEIGYIYSGKATNEVVISTLVQLANKGYIKIEEVERKGIIHSKTFKIIKLKNYVGSDYIEKTFFEGLFKYGEPDPDTVEEYINESKIIGEKISKSKLNSFKKSLEATVVTEDILKNKFYPTINKIKNYLIKNEGVVYDKNYSKQKKIKSMFKTLCFLALCYIFIKSNATLVQKTLSIAILQFSIVKFFDMFFFERKITIGNILSVIISGGFSTYFINTYVSPSMDINYDIKQFYIFILTELIIIAILNLFMPRPTSFGSIILGKIRGFRRFLENAEKDQLEALVEKDPKYFYNILPYTYALGVSKKWMKQFESMAIEPPKWFNSSYSSFDAHNFTSSLDSTIRNVSDSMTFGEEKYREPKTSSSSSYSYSSSSSSSSDSSSSYSSSSSSSSSYVSSGGGHSGGGSGGRRRKFLVTLKEGQA